MKSLFSFRLAGLAGLAALFAVPAFAQDEPGYFYLGGSFGQSRAKIDEPRIDAELLSQGLVTSSMTRNEKDKAWKAFAGYQFNRYVGIEGGYFSLGRFGFTSTTVPAGTLDGRIRLHGLNLDLVGTLPIYESLSIIGRVGGQYATAHDTFRGTGAVVALDPNPSKSAVNYKVGAGLQYALTRNLMLRGEAERYRVNDAVGNHGDVNVFSAGLVWAFGRGAAPVEHPLVAQVYEAPPAAPPSPPPVAVIAPPPPPPSPAPMPVPPPRRVSFEADTLFGFDRSTIAPKGEEALNKFAQELQGMRFERITVEGHTDRLGTSAYNEKLSQRRAEAVKSYLTKTGGIDPAKVSAVGKGETQPVTKTEDCHGKKQSAKLIACLQPDRRVDVEVTGTAEH
jgi:OOP family OmpA-OmpF porin